MSQQTLETKKYWQSKYFKMYIYILRYFSFQYFLVYKVYWGGGFEKRRGGGLREEEALREGFENFREESLRKAYFFRDF